ncbi:hypothetical protein SCOR_12680 [Sulfidibacter corallicola]|uniref:Response regulatory domain-containing protein n=1 Tax=Sulfidibacter corallicola TaxID=2818388 RepID=A0A8A4TE36_SULCO|nr:hypothetical protein [Sulfidibacter corallicola]QTD47817.1 hypothetical protein J3U87_19690 [Sulfidibacter corallicola]
MAKKKKKHPSIADRQEIQIILGKLMHKAQAITLKVGGEKVRCLILDELEDSFILRLDAEIREKHGLQPRTLIHLTFYYEGKEYYGSVAMLGFGRYENKEAIRLAFPQSISINDEFGLTQLHLTPRKELTFTSTLNKLCDGQVVNIGLKGIDLKSAESEPIRELLAVNLPTSFGFELNPDLRIHCTGNVLYIQSFGEQLVGIEFEGLDKDTQKMLADWIHEESLKQRNQDLHFLRERKQRREKQAAGSMEGEEEAEEIEQGPRLEADYANTVLSEGDSYILLLSRDKELLTRMGKSLKRKYGVLISKGRFSNVQKIVEYYQPTLILIDENLATVSGYDVCNTINKHIEDEQQCVLMGEVDEGGDKRERALEVGAMEYLVNSPFRPLSFFKTVDELVTLSSGGI